MRQPLTIGGSFEKMGIGSIGGLGGRMGELEKASLRLGEAAAERERGLITARAKQERETMAYSDWLEEQKRKRLEREARKSGSRGLA